MSCPKCPPSHSKAEPKRRSPSPMTWLYLLAAVALAILFVVDAAHAAVYHSKESALDLAFPDADSVVTQSVFLDDAQVQTLQREAGSAPEARILNCYVGYLDGAVMGRAYFETHRVRTLPETLLVVVAPDGRVRAVHLIAFHEPPEYRATDSWLAQYAGRGLDDDLALGRGVAGIGGATLTAQAVHAAVRRVLALELLRRAASQDHQPPSAEK